MRARAADQIAEDTSVGGQGKERSCDRKRVVAGRGAHVESTDHGAGKRFPAPWSASLRSRSTLRLLWLASYPYTMSLGELWLMSLLPNSVSVPLVV